MIDELLLSLNRDFYQRVAAENNVLAVFSERVVAFGAAEKLG
jgi:hypothetical protein